MQEPINNYIITGTSGTGKSTLIEALRQQGFPVFNEAQRDILERQLAIDGPALPSKDPAKFIRALLNHCQDDLTSANNQTGPCFFDRGIPEVGAYAIRFDVDIDQLELIEASRSYNKTAFILPPWREIFHTDKFRGKSFDEYAEFHSVITNCYVEAGFGLVEVPRSSIEERVSFVLDWITRRGV